MISGLLFFSGTQTAKRPVPTAQTAAPAVRFGGEPLEEDAFFKHLEQEFQPKQLSRAEHAAQNLMAVDEESRLIRIYLQNLGALRDHLRETRSYITEEQRQALGQEWIDQGQTLQDALHAEKPVEGPRNPALEGLKYFEIDLAIKMIYVGRDIQDMERHPQDTVEWLEKLLPNLQQRLNKVESEYL